MTWLPQEVAGCEAGLGALCEAPGFVMKELWGDVCLHSWAVTILCLQPFFLPSKALLVILIPVAPLTEVRYGAVASPRV